ncbi:hypothetical protein ACFGVR_19245 [Mucilaginibacter sp. AW1-3]
MQTEYYLDLFQHAAEHIDLSQTDLELKVGVWLNSVVLKIQKPSWRNSEGDAFQSGIFFSVWLNDELLSKNKLYYNIHALKLRELNSYRLKSRDFAEAFRDLFKPFEVEWPNVSTGFGPLTLMEGWVELDTEKLEKQVHQFSSSFLRIYPIIDKLLLGVKK